MESLAIGQVEDGRVGEVEVIVVTMSDCMTVADALLASLLSMGAELVRRIKCLKTWTDKKQVMKIGLP